LVAKGYGETQLRIQNAQTEEEHQTQSSRWLRLKRTNLAAS
jgi:hypothetical protein